MANRPNILHIMTDQQRWDTINALGNPVIRTPNLNRLVDEGTTFTSAFTPSPVCVPARCSMLYGQYPPRTACTENWDMPTDDRQTLMETLAGAGYHTYGIGKCHFAPDLHANRGFAGRERQEGWLTDPAQDEYVRYLYDSGYSTDTRAFGVWGPMYYIPQPSQVELKHHPDTWVAERSMRFINERADTEQPWYLFSSFLSPHPPFCPPRPWHTLYPELLMPLPKVPAQAESLLTWTHAFQNRYKFRGEGTDIHLQRLIKASYYAQISYVDYLLGQLLDTLESTGQLENTLIIFMSDHGEYLGDYGCYGKRGMHDASARIPLLCRYPERFTPGARVDTPVSLVDLMPTMLAAAGTELTTHTPDGHDLAEVATGNVEREYVFSQYDENDMAVFMAVSKRWKYIYSVADRREFLFDRLLDPEETRNVADNGLRNGVTAEIRKVMHNEIRAAGAADTYLDGDNWHTFDTQTVHRGWQWWAMHAPRDAAWNPDSSFAIGSTSEFTFPEGYKLP